MAHQLLLSPKIFLQSAVFVGLVFIVVRSDGDSNNSLSSSNPDICELGYIFQSLLMPSEVDTLQVQALRLKLIRLLKALNMDFPESIEDLEDLDEIVDDFPEEIEEDKRSINSLVRNGNFPFVKKNIASLARNRYFTIPSQERDYDYKRSIATLAKNGQLPNFSPLEDVHEDDNITNQEEESKRSIEALARNGYLSHKREHINNILQSLTDKRNLASLARNYNLPSSNKRNVASLARLYSYPYGKSFTKDDELRLKKNIASVIRNGKRFIGSLARNDNLRSKNSYEEKRNLQALLKNNEYPVTGKRDYIDEDKRNLQSLMRNNEHPTPGTRRNFYDNYKRNIGSIVRDFGRLKYSDKRNAAALLRQDAYMRHESETSPTQTDETGENEKRNIASIKSQLKKRSIDHNGNNGSRVKREVDYSDNDEYSVPVYQNTNFHDYEELIHALTEEYPNIEKKFLGSVARGGGWYQGINSGFRQTPNKRHIGSLAKIGWLPAFRSTRRFSRSGRSDSYDNVIPNFYRPYSSNGSTEDNSSSRRPSLATLNSRGSAAPIPGAKRYLLLPALDSELFRKISINPSFLHRDCL